MNEVRTRKIAIMALLGAISAVLMYFDFPLPIAPSFMKMDLSDLPIIVGGFILCPIASIIIAIIKILLKIIIKGTSTMFLGELANIIGSISYALPASIIYNNLKNKKRAIIGFIVGILAASFMCTICNAVFLFPLYINIFHMSEEAIIKMCSAIIPSIDSMTKVMLLSVFPFNLIKYIITSILTYILYKNISKFIKSIINK